MPRARFISLLLVLLTLLSACASRSSSLAPTSAPQTASPAPKVPPHLTDAFLLLSQLRPSDTNYQHRPTIVTFEDAAHDHAECRADCSGFIAALLEHSYHLSDQDLHTIFGANRPLAHHFVAAIESSRRFTPITHIDDALPGDIIAIRYPSGNDNTGHVMLLAATPRPRPASAPLVDHTQQWDLDIIDATSSPHSNDTRHTPGHNRSGAGQGTFRLYTNPDGSIAGHAWSDHPDAAFHQVSDRPLVIGRFIP